MPEYTYVIELVSKHLHLSLRLNIKLTHFKGKAPTLIMFAVYATGTPLTSVKFVQYKNAMSTSNAEKKAFCSF